MQDLHATDARSLFDQLFDEVYDELLATLEAMCKPHWAERIADGEWVVNAQLCTKDGRRIGNAVITGIQEANEESLHNGLYDIVTDFGTNLSLTLPELEELFYPPVWVVQADRVRRRVEYMLGYEE